MTIQQSTAPQALRRAKDAAGETNRSLAEKSGVPEHTVAKILSGATNSPTYDQVAAMASVLDLDLNTLDHAQPADTGSAPTRGPWIEIFPCRSASGWWQSRPPHGGRGLKSSGPGLIWTNLPVGPHTGAVD